MSYGLGITGFALASILYTIMLLQLNFVKKNNQHSKIINIVFSLSIAWLLLCLLYLNNQIHYNHFIFIETARNIAWVIILSHLLRKKINLSAIFNKKLNAIISFITISTLLLCEIFLSIYINQHQLIAFLHLFQSLFILYLLEQLFRRTEKTERWKIKPICLGLGIIITYEFAFFSNAMLVNSIDHALFIARGWIYLIGLPFIIITIRRVHFLSLRVYISRDVVFNSTLLIASSAYLISMSLVGYLIKHLNYNWSGIFQYVFLLLSGFILISLFLSESFRSNLKVFIAKHFYENKYDYREEWIKFSQIKETYSTDPYQVALLSLMNPLNCEKGVIFALENNRLIKRTNYAIDENKLTIIHDLINAAIKHNWIIDLDELKQKKSKTPFKINNIDLIEQTEIKYIIPICEAGEHYFACLLSKSKKLNKLDFEDRDLIKVISKQVSIYLNLNISNSKLAENEQFNAFNQTSTFLIHDLKNILTQLHLISTNSKKHKNNPEFINDTFTTVNFAANRLEKVLSHLSKHNTNDENEAVNICDTIIEACTEKNDKQPIPIYDSKLNDTFFVNTNKERLKNVFLHLIQNAQDATNNDGYIKISKIDDDNFFAIRIEDNGIGMSKQFIENKLFKPFFTTKGNAGIGIGAYDAKQLIEQLDGYVNVFSSEGKGTKFEIYLPNS